MAQELPDSRPCAFLQEDPGWLRRRCPAEFDWQSALASPRKRILCRGRKRYGQPTPRPPL